MKISRKNLLAAALVVAVPVTGIAAVQLGQASGFLEGIGRTSSHQFAVKATEYSVNISAPDSEGYRTLKVSVPVEKIDTENRVRNWHMRSSVFAEGLDKDINTVEFEARSNAPIAPGGLRLAGQLNINGLTKPLTLHLEITGDETLKGVGLATVDLDDYGIAQPGMGPMQVQKKVTMRFEIAVPRSKLEAGLPVAFNFTQ